MSRICLATLKGMKEHNSRAMMMAGAKASPVELRSESGNITKQRRWTQAGDREPLKKIDGLINDQQRRKLREAQKAENVMHLIFWGPK